MTENRKQIRQKTFLKGRILFNKGASSMDCLVRDMSISGARLALTETSTLPESFELFIPQKGRTYRAQLCWRRSDGIGITFLDEAAPASPVAPPPGAPTGPAPDAAMLALVRRISELEAENAALRRMLAGQPVGAA